jgi:molybdenum cofactor cytidylyltransferase
MSAPRIAAIVLAAGRSTRMGAGNKLLAQLDGRPLVRHVVDAALASRARPIAVVVGHQAAAVRSALAGLEIDLLDNENYAAGLSSSLKRGIAALPGDCQGALILLGDMPQITAAHIDRLLAAFQPGAIVVPMHKGRRGNPVLWPDTLFAQIRGLEGDVGAKELMRAHADAIRVVDLESEAIFADVDTPEALERLRGEPSGAQGGTTGGGSLKRGG